VVDSRPEEMMASYPETSSSHRRQDQQDDIADTKSATTPRLLFNTFRSHLNVLRASVTERDEDHYAPHQTAAEMLASNDRYRKTSTKEDDMTWSEKLFFSPEDELVGENEWQTRMYGIAEGEEDTEESKQHQLQHQQRQQPLEVKAEFNFFEDVTRIGVASGDHHDDSSVRTDDGTQVTKMKRRKRGKKARNASMVGAFVTFLKALFGIGMLSNPAVLGETGLILGTFCHLFIVVGCAFACYLLLMSRQIAKQEVALKQQQQESEKRRWEAATTLRTRMTILLGHQLKREGSSGNKGDPNIIEMTPRRSNANDVTRSLANNTSVTNDYQLMTSSLPPPPRSNPPEQSHNVRLITYGDVAKYLAGERASVFIIFTIVAVHLMFASGMVHLAVENLCYVIGMDRLGWSVVQEEFIYDDDRANKFNYYQYTVNNNVNNNDYSSNYNGNDNGVNDDIYNDGYNDNNERHLSSASSSESRDVDDNQAEQMYLQWEGADFTERLTMATMLFPIILLLLQIPSLRELATISSIGLFTYAFGCIGTMMYVSFVETSGHPFQDRPEDILTAKWSGIPTYVATTVYAIEGINLALPTVISVEGIQRVWNLRKNASNPEPGEETRSGGGEGGGSKGTIRPELSVYIVCGAVFFYGFITLIVSWVGLAGGLGGGIGTIHEESGCPDVTYCLNSSGARFVYMLSLAVALILTLPVILYPSTEMLEIWLDEREEKRRKRVEVALMAHVNEIDQQQEKAKTRRNLVKMIRQKSILQVRDDDDTLSSPINSCEFDLRDEQYPSQQHTLEPLDVNTQSPEQNDIKNDVVSPLGGEAEQTKSRINPRMRRVKYWKLRMFLAGTIIVIGTIEGSVPQVLKVAEVIRGVGLSIAGLIFPPLLYMSAVGGHFGTPMAAAMSLLVGLGLFNIILVLMSSFGGKGYIMEEGANFYEIDWSKD